MPLQRLCIIGLCLILLFGVSLNCQAAESLIQPREWAIGWQQSRPASGISLRCPLADKYYLQAIFLVDMANQVTILNQHLEFGLRGIYNLTPQSNFLPYTGIGIGYHEKKKGTQPELKAYGGTGMDIFFGIEYLNSPVHPALEISLGGFSEVNGSFEAGLTGNFMLMYYF